MNCLALLGATASGKTALAIQVAKKLDGIILSLDSLSIYKGIDIASAKPTKEQMQGILHFGIDVINPDEIFNVTLFFELYTHAYKYAQKHNKTLIIVGGTSFYLKAMLTGLSDKPFITDEVKQKVARALLHLEKTYEYILQIDSDFAKNISSHDSYRIEKWLEIHYETGLVPSKFLKQTLKEPIIKDIDIYELVVDKEVLKEKITLRTNQMIENKLIAEIVGLEKKYGRLPRCMNAIGIKEVLSYLDGYCTLTQMKEDIITNTLKLAKRQKTFNKTQFIEHNVIRGDFEFLQKSLC